MTRAAWIGLAVALAYLVITWSMLWLAGLGLDRDQYDFVVDVLWAPWGPWIGPAQGSWLASAQVGALVYLALRWRSWRTKSPEP
jgi:hypothetical protein